MEKMSQRINTTVAGINRFSLHPDMSKARDACPGLRA
jgi:hypothetical protein